MATKSVVTSEAYMSVSRKLHEIERQLLQKGGYPHDLDSLEAVLQRLTEGRFHADEDVFCSVRIRNRDPRMCLRLLRFDNERDILPSLREAEWPSRATSAKPYLAWVTVVRLQRPMTWSEVEQKLESRNLHAATLEESCAYLEKNHTTQQHGPIVCMDRFEKDGKPHHFGFSGDRRRRIVQVRDADFEEPFYPHVRVFAREQVVTIP